MSEMVLLWRQMATSGWLQRRAGDAEPCEDVRVVPRRPRRGCGRIWSRHRNPARV